MARILHSINMTLNGSCDHEDVVADQEHHQYALRLLRSASGVLLGRNTFNLFESFWPDAVSRSDLPLHIREFAAELTDKLKLVMTSTRVQTAWQNTRSVNGPALDELKNSIHELPGTVVVFGSPSLASSLAAAGMLAELHVLVQPLISRSALYLYQRIPDRRDMTLLGIDRFQSGVVLMRYALDA